MTTSDDQKPKDTTEADSLAGESRAAAAGSVAEPPATQLTLNMGEELALIAHRLKHYAKKVDSPRGSLLLELAAEMVRKGVCYA